MQRLGRFICVFAGCDPDPKTCFCKRCGRVKHLGNEEPKLVDSQYKLFGPHQNGFLVYLKTENLRYECLRCGEGHSESICRYEFR